MDVRRRAALFSFAALGFAAAGCGADDDGHCGLPGTFCDVGAACIGGQCTADDRVLWVIARLTVPSRDGNVLDGFDLDGHTSTAEDAEGCGFNDFVSPDGIPGIDNEFAALVPQVDLIIPVLGPPSVQYLLDRSIAEGDILLGVVLVATADPKRVDAYVHALVSASADPLLVDESGALAANQAFTLVSPPQLTALGVDISDGRLELGPFDTQISLLGAVGVPMMGTLLHLEVGDRAGEGITGGAADPAPLIAYQPIVEPLINLDLPLPGTPGCAGTSMAYYVTGVPGVIAP